MIVAVALSIVATVAGCTNGPAPSPGASGSPVDSAAATAGPTTPAASQAPVADLLATAMARLDAGSQFESTVTVDGTVATALAGRTIGSAASLTVTTSGRTVEYIRIPPTAWAREPGATWLVIDAAQAPKSPLDALRAPLSLELDAASPGTLLNATYPAAALGLEGDPVPVTIAIDADTVTFRYAKTSAGHEVVSTTVLRPTTDATPIAPPS